MSDNCGNLSVDFLAGFTIFIIAFIWVATMIPGLLIGLQAHNIDYDAVAYRTGVILVEDPGAAGKVIPGAPCYSGSDVSTVSGPWESQSDKCHIARFGLAVSKDTPGILDENKVNRFFCWTVSADPNDREKFSYPIDYQERAIFGDYPYRFNISLEVAGEERVRSIGDVIPDGNYGYIRRDVQIKGSSNATINKTIIQTKYWSKENVTTDVFTIHLNCTKLLGDIRHSPHQVDYRGYQIDPGLDNIIINITDLNTLHYPTSKTTTNLSSITINPGNMPLGAQYTYIDGNATPVGTLPSNVMSNISLVFPAGRVISDSMEVANPQLYITLTFKNTNPDPTINGTYGDWFLNSSMSGPFEYDYNMANVTQPQLQNGVLEVAVW